MEAVLNTILLELHRLAARHIHRGAILDDLSNSVITLIEVEDWTAAEAVCNQLQQRYPDQVDGVWRMAMVEEARGNRAAATKAYREAAEFMRANDGFKKESIADMIASAERMEC